MVKRFRLEDQVAINGIGEIPAGYVIRSQTKRFKSWLDRHHIDCQVVVGKELLTPCSSSGCPASPLPRRPIRYP